MTSRSHRTARRIVVGLSGGVDSAVAAWLLKQQGHDVVGLFMKNWEDDDDASTARPAQDWLDAASVADVIGIDLEAVNFAAEYQGARVRRVPARVLGRPHAQPGRAVQCRDQVQGVPRPCAAAGRDAHRDRPLRARAPSRGRPAASCCAALDPGKDQSYFLHRLDQQQLSRALFPLGGTCTSREVRRDRRRDRPAQRGQEGFDRHLLHRRAAVPRVPRRGTCRPGPGRSSTTDGHVVGEHVGLAVLHAGPAQGHRHRRDRATAAASRGSSPRKDLADQRAVSWSRGTIIRWLLSTVVVERGRELDRTSRRRRVGSLRRQVALPPGRRAGADRAHRPSGFRIDFEAPQWAATPGQSAVVYDGEVCLGGGVITATEREGAGEGAGRERPSPAACPGHGLTGYNQFHTVRGGRRCSADTC